MPRPNEFPGHRRIIEFEQIGQAQTITQAVIPVVAIYEDRGVEWLYPINQRILLVR